MVSWLQESPWILASFNVRFLVPSQGKIQKNYTIDTEKNKKANKQITKKFAVNKQQQYLNVMRVK